MNKIELQKLLKEEWSIEHVDCCPVFTEMTGGGFVAHPNNRILPGYKFCIAYYKEGEVDWMTHVSDQRRIGKKIISSFIHNQKDVLATYHDWLEMFKLLLPNYLEKYQQELDVLSDNDLIAWADDLYEFYRKKIYIPGFIDGFMFYADKRLEQLVKEFCKKQGLKNASEIFSVLSAPVQPSFINEEETELLLLVEKLKKLKFSHQKDLKKFLAVQDKNLMKQFEKHLLKYSWIKTSYFGHVEYSWMDISVEVARLLKTKKPREDVFKKHKKDKKILVKKYVFNPEILAISKLTEILVKWQDLRKIYSLTYVTLEDKVLREVSRRKGVEFELLKYSQISELKKILDGTFRVSILQDRKKGCLFVYHGGKTEQIITGKEAEKFFKKASVVDFADTKEIKGMSASVGVVKGTVRVVMSAKNIGNVKKGDILVAPMTRPEHLIGMKKAAAIVTDDGGITCHAAIVARELGIPCIIGTKIATKILKDGDLVEVDANNGTVKILKQ